MTATEESTMWKRIGSIVPLLSSPNDGEVANAARSIIKVLKGGGKSIHDLAKRLTEDPSPWDEGPRQERPKEPPKDDWTKREPPKQERRDNGPRRRPSAWAQDKEDTQKAYPKRNQLDSWSEEFLDSIFDQVIHQGRSLTEKQRDKLNEILDKLGL